VLGFKGHEAKGGGNYEIRQDHAHAWVEALVPRPGPLSTLGLLGGGAAAAPALGLPGVASPGAVPPLRVVAAAIALGGCGVGPMVTTRATRNVHEPYYHWVTLDPTPRAAPEDGGLFGGLLGSASTQGEMFFKDFILGYNTALREKTIGAIVDWF